MGIDIYLGGYDAYELRTVKERAAFHDACAKRDRLPEGSPKRKAAQEKVNKTADAMWAGSTGYLRSSYNSGGLFNVLDKIFGTDTGALLFPGEWGSEMRIDWDKFLTDVRMMQAAGRMLKHGDPLPIKFDELQAQPSLVRANAEAFGKSVMGMVTEAFGADNVEAGNEHQAGFFNSDDYEWYVGEGLDDLLAFGLLGKELAAKGENTLVDISY